MQGALNLRFRLFQNSLAHGVRRQCSKSFWWAKISDCCGFVPDAQPASGGIEGEPMLEERVRAWRRGAFPPDTTNPRESHKQPESEAAVSLFLEGIGVT